MCRLAPLLAPRNFGRITNQPIGAWNTSNVVFMQNMFGEAVAFNQQIGAWNTSNVTRMDNMFQTATAFNQPIGSWDTKKVDQMAFMFWRARTFNQDLSGWCVSAISSMQQWFDAEADAWTLSRPVWGTCPGIE